VKKKKQIKFMEREAVLLTDELKAKCEARVKETLDACNKKWKLKLGMPEIRYDLKTLTCGMAMPSLNVLRFHPVFLVENESDYILETIPHEVAHIATKHVAPILRKENPSLGNGKVMAHGQEWRIVMEFLDRGPKPGQTWKDVIKHVYDPSSIQLPVRKKHGPRKPGGRKVGEIIAKIGTLNEEEMEALKQRLGFDISLEAEPTVEQLMMEKEFRQLGELLSKKFPTIRSASVFSPCGHAVEVIKHLSKGK
jgi:predicted SprT family Zn-dependent metalloprotease